MDFILHTATLRLACLALAIAMLGACAPDPGPAGPELRFTRNDSQLYAGLEHDAPVVALLPFDTSVAVLETYRSFVRVRTSGDLEGWLPSAMLLDQSERRDLTRLKTLASGVPGQGAFRSRDTLNVHIEPYRWAPTFYQLGKDEGFEMVDRMVVDRFPFGFADSATEVEPTGEDYWYLVRIPAVREVGWLLANMAYADVPLEVAALAQGRAIIAHFQIGSTDDESLGQSKPTWLWFQSSDAGQTHDFDRMRVFQWDSRRDRYVVIRQVSEVVGYLPVEILPALQTARGTGIGFRFLLERNGEIHERTYAYVGRRVAYLGEQQLSGAPRLAAPGGLGRRYGRRGMMSY